ncbi:MAG: hypothetical protein ACI4MJ_05425 [Aristaeellaceae bacterium]
MKRILVSLLLVLCLTLCSCSAPQHAGIYQDNAAIARQGDSYTMTSYQHQAQSNALQCTIKASTGMLTLWSMQADADTPVNVDCTLTVQAGRAKLVHIAPDGTVNTLLEVSPDAPVSTSTLHFTALSGNNRVKLVLAKDTTLDMSLTFDAGTVRDSTLN